MPDGQSCGETTPDPGSPAALSVDIAQQDVAWDEAGEALPALIERAVAAALDAAGARVPQASALEVSVVLAGDDFVHDLNRRYRGKDKATNILSFPSGLAVPEGDGAFGLGDLVLAFETVNGEARTLSKPLDQHVAHLIAHGTLHLVGYTHEGDEDGDVMVAAERAALAALGFGDPYAGLEGAAA